MRILILEDEDYRIEWFRSATIGCDLDVTKDVEEAKKWIDDNEYDQIFLDHDLADEHYEAWRYGQIGYDESTGYCVAKHLAENPHRSPNAEIVVHSMNPSGSRRMVEALKDRNAKWISFPILRK